jgi:predicted transcriptional regulator
MKDMTSENVVDKLIGELSLLERHITMLKVTKANQPIGIIRLSEILNVPKHKVRYSLRLLEQEGLISPSTDGAMVTDKYDAYMAETSEKLDKIVETVERLKKEIPQ